MRRLATFLAIAALLAAPLAYAGDTTANTNTGHQKDWSGQHGQMMGQHQQMMGQKGQMMGQNGQMTPEQMLTQMNTDSKNIDQQFMAMQKKYDAMMKLDDMTQLKAQMKEVNQMMANLRQEMMQRDQMQSRMQSVMSQYSQNDPSGTTKK